VTNRMVYTDAEKLEVVEMILDRTRSAHPGGKIIPPQGVEVEILKSICVDLRMRSAAPSNKVLDALAFQINSAMKARVRLGYVEVGHYQAIAEALILHWPTVRVALEHINGEKKS
jgi:hypothetical protein